MTRPAHRVLITGLGAAVLLFGLIYLELGNPLVATCEYESGGLRVIRGEAVRQLPDTFEFRIPMSDGVAATVTYATPALYTPGQARPDAATRYERVRMTKRAWRWETVPWPTIIRGELIPLVDARLAAYGAVAQEF
jgi:hypothetical protein